MRAIDGNCIQGRCLIRFMQMPTVVAILAQPSLGQEELPMLSSEPFSENRITSYSCFQPKHGLKESGSQPQDFQSSMSCFHENRTPCQEEEEPPAPAGAALGPGSPVEPETCADGSYPCGPSSLFEAFGGPALTSFGG